MVARIELATTGSAVAAAQRDRIVAQANYQLQETQFKKLLSKRADPELDAAGIETLDELPAPSERDVPELNSALAAATEERPELHIAQQDLANQDISARFTRNALLPNLSAFSLFAGAGLAGDNPKTAASSGAGKSLFQDFAAEYPEYASGLSVVLPLRNRAAQADNLRARFEQQSRDQPASRQRAGDAYEDADPRERYRAPIASGIVIRLRASASSLIRFARTHAPITLVTAAGSTMNKPTRRVVTM